MKPLRIYLGHLGYTTPGIESNSFPINIGHGDMKDNAYRSKFFVRIAPETFSRKIALATL